MANLDDLPITPYTELSNDEAIELLRQIRLSRRVPVKQSKAPTKRVSKPKIDASAIDPTAALELLKILGETK